MGTTALRRWPWSGEVPCQGPHLRMQGMPKLIPVRGNQHVDLALLQQNRYEYLQHNKQAVRPRRKDWPQNTF